MSDEKEKNMKDKKPVLINVSGTDHNWPKDDICFEDLVFLVYGAEPPNPNIEYHVSYVKEKGGEEIEMEPTECIKAKEGLEFDVTRTDRS